MEDTNLSEEERPQKKSQTSDSEGSIWQHNTLGVVEGRSQWTAHDRYYFGDGHIVILAETTLFRVHRSVLSLNSKVFKDVLSIPQPTSSTTVDGCPLLCLSESARQVGWMLETFYDGGTSRFLDPSKTLSVVNLCSILRIANKYDIPHVCKRASKRLLSMFPPDKARWYPIERSMAFARLVFRLGSIAEELAMVVDIIRTIDHLTPILPLVLYTYCQLPVDQIATSDSGASCSLSAADTMLCLQALPKLMKHKSRIFSTFTDGKILRGCEDRNVCQGLLFSIVNARMESDDGSPSTHQFSWYTSQAGWDMLCHSCRSAVTNEVTKRREVAWNDLGRIFKVTSWPVALNSKLLEDSE